MSFSHQSAFKKLFLTKKGVEIRNKKRQKVPLDDSEIQLMSQFGVKLMKIAAFRCCDEHHHHPQQTSHTPYRELHPKDSITPSSTLYNSP